MAAMKQLDTSMTCDAQTGCYTEAISCDSIANQFPLIEIQFGDDIVKLTGDAYSFNVQSETYGWTNCVAQVIEGAQNTLGTIFM